MGVFLFVLGIFLVLNVIPLIAGAVNFSYEGKFSDGFGIAWILEILFALGVGFIWIIVWLISTGWTMMQGTEGVIY